MQRDLLVVAQLIQNYVERRDGLLTISVSTLARELASYIRLRRTTGRFMIERVRSIKTPIDWTEHSENVWLDWISLVFDLDSWNSEVIQPLFGTEIRAWEYDTEWRQEIFVYLEEWIQRNNETVAKFDMTPVEEVEDELYGGLDPYMVENGLIKFTGTYSDH